MKNTFVCLLRAGLVAALLSGAGLAAHSRVSWSVGVDLGSPLITTLPQGAVSVQVGGGHGRYGHYGHYGHYGRHGRHGYRPGHAHGGVGWVLVAPPVVFPLAQRVGPDYVADAPLPVPESRPDPVIYPRNGQDARQTEYDRQDCNRWATTQPAALADATVFQRAVEACMDGRGYTLK